MPRLGGMLTGSEVVVSPTDENRAEAALVLRSLKQFVLHNGTALVICFTRGIFSVTSSRSTGSVPWAASVAASSESSHSAWQPSRLRQLAALRAQKPCLEQQSPALPNSEHFLFPNSLPQRESSDTPPSNDLSRESVAAAFVANKRKHKSRPRSLIGERLQGTLFSHKQ